MENFDYVGEVSRERQVVSFGLSKYPSTQKKCVTCLLFDTSLSFTKTSGNSLRTLTESIRGSHRMLSIVHFRDISDNDDDDYLSRFIISLFKILVNKRIKSALTIFRFVVLLLSYAKSILCLSTFGSCRKLEIGAFYIVGILDSIMPSRQNVLPMLVNILRKVS